MPPAPLVLLVLRAILATRTVVLLAKFGLLTLQLSVLPALLCYSHLLVLLALPVLFALLALLALPVLLVPLALPVLLALLVLLALQLSALPALVFYSHLLPLRRQ